MSKIPYFFETPVPKYFRETGWFQTENTFKFVTWAFSRCQNIPHKEVIGSRELLLQPFEFIAGRLSSPAECFMSEEAFRHQLKCMLNAGFLKKTPNSAPNKFTCYIWVTDRFSNTNPQPNAQLTPNKPPTNPHESRSKKIRYKQDHPSEQKKKTDDFFSHKETIRTDHEQEKKIFQPKTTCVKKHKNEYEIGVEITLMVNGQEKVIGLSDQDYQKCLSVKGSHDAVKHAMVYILQSPKRKYDISNWPEALTRWQIRNNIIPILQANEELAKRLVAEFSNKKSSINGFGWVCELYHDRLKDISGVLFSLYSPGGCSEDIFIPYIDPTFEQTCNQIIKDKKMKKTQ